MSKKAIIWTVVGVIVLIAIIYFYNKSKTVTKTNNELAYQINEPNFYLDYKNLIKSGKTEEQAVDILSASYGLDKDQVLAIINKNK